MANLIASRAQLSIAGVPTSAFNIPQDYLSRIFLDDQSSNIPLQGLNYLAEMNTFATSTRIVTLVFEYFYKDDFTLFDFSNLPYQLTNIQALLTSKDNTPIALVSGLYNMSTKVLYNSQSSPVKRQVIFNARRADYFFI